MKKTLLLLALSLACIMAHAQKIDTTLLYGKWDLYSSGWMGQTMYRDSMDRNMKAMKVLLKTGDAKIVFTSRDSLGMVDVINDLFKTYRTFDKEGHTTWPSGGNKSDPVVTPIETGTYEWSGENEIRVHTGPVSLTFTILKLTTTKLAIRAKGADTDGEMSFTRAK